MSHCSNHCYLRKCKVGASIIVWQARTDQEHIKNSITTISRLYAPSNYFIGIKRLITLIMH